MTYKIAHVFKHKKWHYLKCVKRGCNWLDIKTKKIIDKRLIHNITDAD